MCAPMRSYRQYCSVAKALDVVGDRWTLLIVRELILRGPCRYTDLQNGLPGIATNLLAQRLRALEEAGVIRREAAPPPVATTLFHLTPAGEELWPVMQELGRWGVRFMPQPVGDEEFRSHWLAFPISEFLNDRDPDGPPIAIEVRTGDQPVTIRAAHGEVKAELGSPDDADLVLTGPPPLILGVVSGSLGLDEAGERGLEVVGDVDVLLRLQPQAARRAA
jgi:DNA-binding HxlR family transcriptional regulator